MYRIIHRAISILWNEGFVSLVKSAIHFLAARLLYLIGPSVPSKPGLFLFGSSYGRGNSDNSGYLYQWVLENRPDLNPYWVTQDKEVYRRLQSEGSPVIYSYSIRGFYITLRAECIFTTHGFWDVGFSPLRPPVSVNLWHGVPIRKPSGGNSKLEHRPQHIITTWEGDREICSKYRGYTRENVHITGLPRNDSLIDIPEETQQNWRNYFDDDPPEFVLFYAPTQRCSLPQRTFEFLPFEDYNSELLVEFLEKNNVTFLIRLHPNDYERIYLTERGNHVGQRQMLDELRKSDQVYLMNDNQNHIRDANQLLPFVDVLITDYSSIYHDFLLLDRPVFFVPYDYDQFKKQGFVYDYREHLPGPEIHTLSEFLANLEAVLKGKDSQVMKRRKLRDKIHKYQDANSSKRIISKVDELRTQSN